MSERLIDPNLRFVEVYIDELHWVKMTEDAKERGVPIDKLLGTVIEVYLQKTGKIKVGEVSESPLRVDITLEPVREDEEFLDALISEREQLQKDRKIAEMIESSDTTQYNWGDL